MLVTIDTSVLIAVIGHEASRPRAIELTRGHDLIAPASVHWEVGNALSAMIKRKRITLAQGISFVEAYAAVPVTLINVELDSSLALVSKFGIYAYDAYILACARDQESLLLTLDLPLQKAARAIGIKVLEI